MVSTSVGVVVSLLSPLVLLFYCLLAPAHMFAISVCGMAHANKQRRNTGKQEREEHFVDDVVSYVKVSVPSSLFSCILSCGVAMTTLAVLVDYGFGLGSWILFVVVHISILFFGYRKTLSQDSVTGKIAPWIVTFALDKHNLEFGKRNVTSQHPQGNIINHLNVSAIIPESVEFQCARVTPI